MTVLLTYDEAAKRLGLCVKTLRHHVKQGHVKYVLVGKRTKRFTWADLEAFIEKQRREECPLIKGRTRHSGTTDSNIVVYDFGARREKSLERKHGT